MLRFSDVDEIRDLTGCSAATFYRWRKNPKNIPASARKLIELHNAGRILPERFGSFRDDTLHTDTGFKFKRCELEQFGMYMSFWRTTVTENDQLRDYIEYLESVTPRAPVIPFPASRTRPSATIGREINYLFGKD